MKGKDVLWQPGTDHAGIATQMVGRKKQLKREGITSRSRARKRRISSKEYGNGKIGIWRNYCKPAEKRLGASADWE